MPRYRLDRARDIDDERQYGHGYILNLPYGWRFYDEIVHVRGYDTMRELKRAVRDDVIVCDCDECNKHKEQNNEKTN